MNFKKRSFISLILIVNFFVSQSSLLLSSEILVSEKEKKEKAQDNIQNDAYVLGEGDFLNLQILGAKDLSGVVPIINDGTISIPTIGRIKVSGLTIDSASKKIEKLLSTQLLQSNVEISLNKTRPVRVAIIGEVSKPGVYLVSTKNSSIALPTVVDAIFTSGGFTNKADLKNVYLTRKLGDENNGLKRAKLNLLDMIQKGNLSQNPFLFDGDIIKVEKADFNEISNERLLIAKSNLSPDLITINVVGEVLKPGQITVKSNTSLVQGILAAGGPAKVGAKIGAVKLLRIDQDGNHKVKSFRYDLKRKISDQKNPILLEGDTIVVNQSLFGRTTQTIGAISKPATGIIQVWTLLKLINDD